MEEQPALLLVFFSSEVALEGFALKSTWLSERSACTETNHLWEEMLHGRDQGIKFSHPHFNHWTRGQEIADSDTHFNHWTRGQEIADSDSHFNRWTQLPDPEHPREVYRLWTVQLPDPEHPREVNRLWTTQLPDPEHPREDNRWFPWLKSKFGIKKRGESLAWLSERSAYTEINHLWEDGCRKKSVFGIRIGLRLHQNVPESVGSLG
ncbi:hypothetical protein QYF36_024930 [Acer negundo]|nr:hypothetical protein QYF36_024930 [Acer negundo]